MTMPNVLMIGPDCNAQGGMATVESNILEAIRARGDRADFISTYEEGSKAKKCAVAARAYLTYLRRIGRYDLVHVHMASRGSYERKKLFMKAAFRRGVPVLLHLHGAEFEVWFDRECNDSKRNDIRTIFSQCAKVVVLSEEWRDLLLDRVICDKEAIAVLHNAVYVPSRNLTDYENRNVLFMGRLGERKGADVLLRAASEVLSSFPDAFFTLAGDGDVEFYKAMADELGIAERCSFPGWVSGDDRDRLYLDASVYCLPSKNEGMPMSVLEAMSYGLATVTTPVGGIPQVIENGRNGKLVQVGDSATLADAISSLLADTNLKRSIGEGGRDSIAAHFGMDKYFDSLLAIYEGMLRDRRPVA